MYRFLFCKRKFSFNWGKCQRFQLLECMVAEYLVFQETAELFFRLSALFYIPINSI